MSVILRVERLEKTFRLEAGLFASSGRRVWAVNGVSLAIDRGETYGLVGESGSGKTTLARTLVFLHAPSSGNVDYYPEGSSDSVRWRISRDDSARLREYRSQARYIFQDPASSLDPRMSVYQILTTGMRYSPRFPGWGEVDERVREAMRDAGVPLVPGSNGAATLEEVRRAVLETGLPVLLKSETQTIPKFLFIAVGSIKTIVEQSDFNLE